jgi:tetratricopeptide (TPR) repeat protein
MKQSRRLVQMGLRFLALHRVQDAADCFEYALGLEQRDEGEPSPRVVSYCGYTFALGRNCLETGLRMCQKAVEKSSNSPDLLCNLGEVYLACGNRVEAHRVFTRGIEINPGHTRIGAQLRQMGIRRPPVFHFLPRGHFLNRVLGRSLRG